MFQIHARSLVFHRCFPHPPRENLSIHEDFISEECLGLGNLSDLELSPLLTLSYVDGLCDCKLQVTRLWEQKPENLLGAGLLLVSFKQPFLLSDNSNVDHCPQRGDRCCSSPLWKRSP